MYPIHIHYQHIKVLMFLNNFLCVCVYRVFFFFFFFAMRKAGIFIKIGAQIGKKVYSGIFLGKTSIEVSRKSQTR